LNNLVNGVVRRNGMPQIGEFVICKITRINPNSAFAVLEEYEKEGMVHISEVKRGWVRDIRNFVKINQMTVAKVVRIDERSHIGLSLKRVDKNQKNERIKEYKFDQRAEKMLELIARGMKKSLEQAYEEVGYNILENFGSLYKAFKMSIQSPELLIDRGIPKEWVDAIKEIAEKNVDQKEFEFKAKISIKSYESNGIILIKDLIKDVEKMGFGVRYIAAPEYLVDYKTKYAKKGNKEFEEKLEKIEKLGKGKLEITTEVI